MNNKKLGTEFEQRVCDMLASEGYWAHFIVPDARGAQPFDIIAVKDGKAMAIDCKTCSRKVFNISRLEDNQIFAFEKWLRCGNSMPQLVIEHKNNIYMIPYKKIKDELSVKLGEEFLIERFQGVCD